MSMLTSRTAPGISSHSCSLLFLPLDAVLRYFEPALVGLASFHPHSGTQTRHPLPYSTSSHIESNLRG